MDEVLKGKGGGGIEGTKVDGVGAGKGWMGRGARIPLNIYLH